MRTNNLKAILKAAVRVLAILPFAACVALGQQTINLTAGPAKAYLPDGSAVPMWGYSCGTAVTGATATCVALNNAVAAGTATVGTWSPVVITVPSGQYLTISLTNNLTFTPTGATTPNTVPTSLVIVGQLGGGLGILGQRTATASPDHTKAQPVTWPIAGDAPGAGLTGVGTPPTQGARVQSFGTEVGVTPAAGQCTTNPCPLTFGTATAPLRPGTYLIESGTHPSIQGPMGLYGVLVVTCAPGAAATTACPTPGTAYPAVAATTTTAAVPAVTYGGEANLLFSEIDPVQNNAVQAAVNTVGFSETKVWSGQPGGCGNPSSGAGVYQTCYPPAVNYSPLYYLINGVAFDKTHAAASVFNAAAGTDATTGLPVTTGITGTVLLRLVNAGLRMHVPSVVGSQTGTAVAPALPPGGFSLIAEDGNPLPGVPRVQSEVFMAAGKTYDVMINPPAAGASALPVYDRQLSLSANATARDSGMLAYVSVNGAGLPAPTGTASGVFANAIARADSYSSLVGVAGQPFTVSDPGKGVVANDTNVYGVQLLAAPTSGTVTLNADGTFTYVPTGTGTSDSFTYCANGTVTGTTCSSGLTATVTLGAGTLGGITVHNRAYTSHTATSFALKSPGVLGTQYDTTTNSLPDTDSQNYPLTVVPVTTPTSCGSGTYVLDANGGFTVSVPSTPGTTPAAGICTFQYTAKNSQGTTSSSANVTVSFPAGSGLQVKVLDGADKTTEITDYRWVIEEDRTFYVDPNCTTNTATPPAGCPVQTGTTVPPTFGVNFHTSYMPLVAAGCTGPVSCEGGQTIVTPTGTHVNAVCDIGNGVCRPDTTGNGFAPAYPNSIVLDPTKRYFISVLPGDAANPFINAYGGAPDCSAAGVAAGSCGHGMGGAAIPALPTGTTAYPTTPYTILTQPTPFPPAQLSVFVFEDDFPLNGEQDGGGGIPGAAVNTNNEPGLGGFEITLFDDAGGTGDATGQLTHDMFNQPLSNTLAGTIDPLTGQDACPITKKPLVGMDSSNGNAPGSLGTIGITGRIVTCPEYESDGITASPLAGQALVPNMMQGRYGVVATPAADRIARGEEWLQTNTLDGQKAHDSWLRIGEPTYFQEYGPAGWHVAIGFANPAIINSRLAGVCGGTDPNITGSNCHNTVTGIVTTERMSRTPDERLFGSGTNDSFAFTQCYVSFGDPDGEDFAFTKCNSDGTFTLTGLPDGIWRLTVFDQWNDMLVDGLSTPVGLSGGATKDLGQIATSQWQANIITATFFDQNGDGVRQDTEPGLSLVPTNIRFRDGSYSNFNNTDLNGNAGFNEIFPLFSWYVIETDSTRYKTTGTHVVYDAGGPADGTPCGTPYPNCGTSTIAANMANTYEAVPLPANLHVPGAVYCSNADCTGTKSTTGVYNSTGRIDPPWVASEGWQGFSGQNSFIEFGKKPFAVGETGGIRGEVNYASTRPFDDPQLLLHVSWTPDVPNVPVNLYKEGFAADGVTPTLTLVDHTTTTSWDDWAQGFNPVSGLPNMNCPGQSTSDLFYFSLQNQPDYLDVYNSRHGGPAAHTIPNSSQFKCYDGMHNWNQIQPAPYDGFYQFPSVTGINPTNGQPLGTNCTGCTTNPDTTDPYRFNSPMLPPGKYVVEVVVPPGYELVKEEDKNILIGDNYIAPVTQQFGALGSIYIMPDQAAVAASYNANNAQNQTTDLGSSPRHEGDTGSVEQFWPCVGEQRVVPDFMSIFPQAQEVAAFAGATRPLCDRKEIDLQEQMSALAKFYIFSSAHVAAHFTGIITDDYTSEFDPFSPQFGEKFSPPDMPISIKDWAGNEINRVYSDHWGTYDGLTYSSWEVNPPNPTGYGPTMMVTCMNDPGTGATPDPLFNSQYSQFCYEIPFMPGQTQYMDTPVVPTSAFAGAGYNNVDCSYPDATPAVAEVDGDGLGPWVSAAGHTLTIHSLGDQMVPNNAYAGPSATTVPYNQKFIKRHFGFGTAAGTVTIGGVAATVGTWSDSLLTVTVPSGVQPCPVQQQAQYSGSTALCGELIITTGNVGTAAAPIHRQSIDTVTVTIGGKPPKHVTASQSIQAAIDAATPGDMIMVDPAFTPAATAPAGTSCATATAPSTTCVETTSNHYEMLIMWKPVRLQGVGGATSIINANAHPAGKLDTWRQQVVCLFGLGINGAPINTNPGATDVNQIPNQFNANGVLNPATGAPASCPGAGWNYFNAFDESSTGAGGKNAQVDRLPLEATVGWSAELNGNLAELLQEPSLMGALEGGGITVLSKGVVFPSDPYDATLLAGFPAGTLLLQNAPGVSTDHCTDNPNPYPSNFMCNPSSIDGLGITNSSQGGGGIHIHGWGHNLQIANNRIYNNAGTLSGGINLGQGEYPPAYVQGSATNAAPGSCEDSPVPGAVLPYCQNVNVNIRNNYIASNSSTGDELFAATPAGSGGISICTGSDYYKFNWNWVCGNLTGGDGGGVGHLGFSFNGDIEHNTIIFNQSTNPTIPANGGGLVVMGAPDQDLVCSAIVALLDQDCAPTAAVGGAASVGPSDGVGPGLVVNANLIMGNAAESGTGAGIAFNAVNGSDMVAFPTDPGQWNTVTVTNNIIVDNVGGWDGAGISLADSPNVNIINNTVAYNNSTASSGILFNTLGAPLASQGGSSCSSTATTTCPQPAGLVAIQHSAVLAANLPSTLTVVCPAGHFQTTAANGSCKSVSYPKLENNIFWRNGTFYIGVGALSPTYQQNIVSIFNSFTHSAVTSQSRTDAITTTSGSATITGGTGACVTGTQYWDIGVRGDTGQTNHASGVQLRATDSVLTPGGSAVIAAGNSTADPRFLQQYCDGSRMPPETPGLLAAGWQVPPGISDATVPNPIFNLAPAATVDEGNNWVNLNWGPLSMTNPTVVGGPNLNYGGGPALGNYGIATGSSAQGRVAGGSANYTDAPNFDFYDNPRKPGPIDAGAVQRTGTGSNTDFTVSPALLDFGFVPHGSPTTVDQDVQVINTGSVALFFPPGNGITFSCTGVAGCNLASFSFAPPADGPGCAGATIAPGQSCDINVVFNPTSGSQAARNANLVINPAGVGAGEIVSLTGHDTIATLSITPLAPALTTTPANATAKTGTVTITNTLHLCLAAPCPGGSSIDAGPFVPTSITITRVSGAPQTAWALGGTCAVGTALSAVPPGQVSSCTITVTYTPPAGATGAALNGSARLTVMGYGTAGATQPATIINTTYNAN